MLCVRCLKNIPKNREVKLKDNSIACNKCAERILKEYHKERYRKYLKGEINYEDLDPPGGGPINNKFKFLEISCSRCLESLARDSEEIYTKVSAVAYDKCKGKKCPDCKKVRHLDKVELEVFKNGFEGFMRFCPRCQKETGDKYNGVCWDCFWEVEEKKGCVCIGNRLKPNLSKQYYCFLCEEIHGLEFWCNRCTTLVREGAIVPLGKKLVNPWKIIVPSVISGVILGSVMTLLVSRKMFRKSKKLSLLTKKI